LVPVDVVVVVAEVDVDPGAVVEVLPPLGAVVEVVPLPPEVVEVVPPPERPDRRLEPGRAVWKARTPASPAAVAATTMGARLISISPSGRVRCHGQNANDSL